MRPFPLLVAVLMGLGVSTPAAAQFKKLKDAVNKAADPKPAAAPQTPGQAAPTPADGGTVAVTPEVVDRVLAGARAAKAERDKAAQEDTPYGRYNRAKAAYDAAKPKCEAAQVRWAQGGAADEKLSKRYTAAVDKAMAAQQKGDMTGYANGMYEALGIIDPSCAVRQPEQPADYYEAERAVEERANQANLKATGFTDREYALASERIQMILAGTEPPGGASGSEKSAVSAKDPELKSLYGIRSAQEQRVSKPAPAADTTRPAAPPQAQAPTMPPGAAGYNQCMVNNIQAHEKELQALGDRGTAAQNAGNTPLMMAIADTIMRIQMAGCSR
jgi:hypothetical protein